jgi:molybdopterin molybdotransferase
MDQRDMIKAYPMRSVEEALQQVLAQFHPLDPERVPILEALDRVLAEDVISEFDIPPHANSAMDGYAVRADDTKGASRQTPCTLRVIGNLAAGYVLDTRIILGTAVRIMTGAPIPPGADAIVRFEDTKREGESVHIFSEIRVGEDLRPVGEDVRRGEQVLRKGMHLRPQDVGMLAALGRANVSVVRRPRVAILATGDELVDVSHTLIPGRIYDANSYSNAAQVLRYGGVPIHLGIVQDRKAVLAKKMEEGLSQDVDLLLVSGGVSVGDFDVVKEVLAAKGEISFWRVRMKPGKPLAFGTIGGKLGKGVPLLGMPGNPVSAMISFELFARPALLTMLGETDLEKPSVEALLVDAIPYKDDRRHYLRVRLEEKDGERYAHLAGNQGSGVLSSMVRADGLAVIPEEWHSVPVGKRVWVMLLD